MYVCLDCLVSACCLFFLCVCVCVFVWVFVFVCVYVCLYLSVLKHFSLSHISLALLAQQIILFYFISKFYEIILPIDL